MASLTPTPKVLAGGIAGAITVIIIYICTLTGVPMTAEVASALTLLIMSAASYFKKDTTNG
jgi:hypothetical protein